ncbi:tail fiber domain-containing protein [Bacillus cereus]|uniref:tail fiber domain-containing protein n=1 Tax=Bacillus cereus TaxID=1396 RepID=UPI000659830C|nr:tail fiber domain-containing protein [Bacillus cereus]KLA34150.1 hypothetical protein B4080_6024 [Bacillus cereus]MCY8952525.1 tail fiber domain-containing protein [Bacillus cereus]
MYRQPPITAQSDDPNVAAVLGNNTNGGIGIRAMSNKQIPLVAEGGGGWPVLFLKNNSSGLLISSLNQAGNVAPFSVHSDGSIETKGYIVSRSDIEASGNIAASGDVWARGVKLTSDKKAKKNFSNVDPFEMLEKLSSLPIQSWSYKDDTSSKRHIGPTAQDFQSAFGLNADDEKYISSTDLHGISLAAIQGLNKKNEELKIENAQLHISLANLEARLSKLESKS